MAAVASGNITFHVSFNIPIQLTNKCYSTMERQIDIGSINKKALQLIRELSN